MKKIFAILVLSLVIATSAFASILQIGPAATINFDASSTDIDSLKDFNRYQFGAEARVNLLFLQLGANGLFSLPNNSGSWAINTMLSANLVAGPKAANISVGAAIPYVLYTNDNSFNTSKFFESPLFFKAGINLNFSFVGLGLSYYIPTDLAANKVLTNIGDIKVDLSKGQLSLAVMFNLF